MMKIEENCGKMRKNPKTGSRQGNERQQGTPSRNRKPEAEMGKNEEKWVTPQIPLFLLSLGVFSSNFAGVLSGGALRNARFKFTRLRLLLLLLLCCCFCCFAVAFAVDFASLLMLLWVFLSLCCCF